MTKEKIDVERNARFMDVVQWLIDNGKAENQGDLTVKVGFGPNIISRIKNNHNNVSEDTLRTLCEKFPDVNIDYIRKGTGNISLKQNNHVEHTIPAIDYSFLIEKAVEKATSYADKTIATLEKQVDDKNKTIEILQARIRELEIAVENFKNENPLKDYPFTIGVSEDENIHTRV